MRNLIIALILSFLPFLLDAETIRVTGQEDFDRLGERILSSQEDDVFVELETGTYYYREGFLDFRGWDRPGFRLSIQGNGSTLIPKGADFVVGPDEAVVYEGAFSPDDCFVSLSRKRPVELRERVKACRTHPLPVNLRKKLFRFRCQEPDLSEEDARDAFIILTQWYVGAVYRVKEIRNGWLYFYADRKYQTKMYEEFRFGRCRPRYVLYNQRSDEGPRIIGGRILSPAVDTLHRCEATVFLSMEDSRIGDVKLSGIRFTGNRAEGYLLRFERLQADSIVVSDCVFDGIGSHVLGVLGTPHLRFQGNTLEGCSLRGVYSDPYSTDSRICRNVFRNHGRRLSTAPAVYCQGPDFRVSDNVFEDFAYSAIGLGTHFMETERPYTSGIVENNEIYQTEAFRKAPMAVLIDSGAIYVWTQNVRTEIRHNYIHDIDGPHGNRGILCDDGAINVSVFDNLILGMGHRSYCIDLRRNYWVGHRRDSFVKRANVGNRGGCNVVDGRLRFHIRKGDPESYREPDIHLKAGYDRESVRQRWEEGRIG